MDTNSVLPNAKDQLVNGYGKWVLRTSIKLMVVLVNIKGSQWFGVLCKKVVDDFGTSCN